jgi:hypothetical protein
VVVGFTGGTLQVGEAEAVDPVVADGTARVQVRRPGITARSVDRTGAGVRARIAGASGRTVIRLSAARQAFKYVRISALHGPERLVIDLYRSRPPARGAEIRAAPDRCLTLTSVQPDGPAFRVRGTEKDLFEGSFLVRVRDASGRVLSRRVMTARGAWSTRVSYRVSRAQAGTVEAVAASAKDGSLDCLVQVRVGLRV